MRISDWSSDVCSSNLGKFGPQQAVGLRDIKTILGYLDVAHAISLAIAGPAHRHGDIAWTIALHEADAGTQRQRFRNRGSRLVGELCAIDARCGLRDRLCILPPTGNDDGLDRHTLDRKSTRLN